MYDVIIVDTHNLFFRNFYVHEKNPDFKIVNGKKTLYSGGVHGSIMSIRRLEKMLNPNGKMIFVADNSTSIHLRRNQIDPDYKIKRMKQSDIVYKQIDFLLKIIESYRTGYKIYRVPEYEADDLIPNIIEIEGSNKKFLLVSTDMDWARMLNWKDVDITWMNGSEVFTSEQFEGKYGFRPSEKSIVIYKSFHGDESDSIPNAVKGLPVKHLMRFVEEDCVDTILNNLHLYGLSDNFLRVIKENAPRIKLNEKLVSFMPISKEEIIHNELDCLYNKMVLKTLFDAFKIPYSLHPELGKEKGISNGFLDDWFKPLKRGRK